MGATRVLAAVLAITAGCTAGRGATPALPTRRVAVLPPCDGVGRPLPSVENDNESLANVLAESARSALARNGFEVVDPGLVARALRGRTPSSPADAAALARAGGIDAPVLFVQLNQWVPNPQSTMRIDSVLVGLDLALLDPASGATLWRVHRTTKPVPIYGTLIIGQGYRVKADSVMTEMLGPLRAPP